MINEADWDLDWELGSQSPSSPFLSDQLSGRQEVYNRTKRLQQRSRLKSGSPNPFLLKIFAALILASVLLLYFIPWKASIISGIEAPPLEDPSQVQTNLQCKIPLVSLHSEAYISAASNNNVAINLCGDSSKFTKFLNATTLILLSPEIYDGRNCEVLEIDRPYSLTSNDTFTLKSSRTFNDELCVTDIDSEHVIVACNIGGEVKFDYHSRVLYDKGFLPLKIQHWKTKSKAELPVNVMVLVLDSTSAVDAFRQLPRTMKYLLEDLNFVYFSRYHALGEPTFLNAIPLLTGNPTIDFFKRKKWHERWDETDFIWKYFNQSQFATAYMEDIPKTGTFNYGNQTGFIYQPTDFYPRSMFTAWEELGGKTKDNCLGNTPIWKYLYSYQLEILRKLNGVVPSFTMPWLCWPFHDVFDTLGALENDTLQFFQELSTYKDVLENTVIIVMGDHGFYDGQYASSDEGLIERRLPLFLLRVPQRLKHLMPNVESVVQHNSRQVTSHYDVFKSLVFLSQLKSDSDYNSNQNTAAMGFGRNIFEILPEGRSCSDAGVPDIWCACNLPEPSPSFDIRRQIITRFRQAALQLLPHEKYVDRSRV